MAQQREGGLLARVLGHVLLFATPWTIACQAPSVHGILQARGLEWRVLECWSGAAISSSRGSS